MGGGLSAGWRGGGPWGRRDPDGTQRGSPDLLTVDYAVWRSWQPSGDPAVTKSLVTLPLTKEVAVRYACTEQWALQPNPGGATGDMQRAGSRDESVGRRTPLSHPMRYLYLPQGVLMRWSFRATAKLAMLVSSAATVGALSSMIPGAAPYAGAWESDVNAGGFDRCQAPSVTTMSHYWTTIDTYWWMGIYIGGMNRACSQPHLSVTWQHAVTHEDSTGAGFDLALVFPGRQSECVTPTLHITPSKRFPSNATAYYYGITTANSAATAATDLGFGGGAIYFDMEPFNNLTGACKTGARYFISGWDYEMGQKGYLGSVYTLYDAVVTFDFGNVPYAVWPSINTPTNPNLFTIPDLPNGLWVNHQRLKQYAHSEPTTVSSVRTKEPLDWDCSTAPLNGASNWHVGCHKT